MNAKEIYRAFIEEIKDINRLRSIIGHLHWDERTMLPPKGLQARIESQQVLARIAHQQFTSPKLGDTIANLKENCWQNLTEIEQANVREIEHDYNRSVKIPTRIVEEISKETALAQRAWEKARAEDKFEDYAPHLEKVVNLEIESAKHLDFDETYDGLLDAFEPGARLKEIRPLMENLKSKLIAFLPKAMENFGRQKVKSFEGPFPIDKQKKMLAQVLEMIGFDFEGGRIDVTTHPFCTGHVGDVRLTTRYNEKNFQDSFFSGIHEGGHGLYQQGLNPEHIFTPMGEDSSLGIHESQSRFWENCVARSQPFANYFFPIFQEHFPENTKGWNAENFFKATSCVNPGFIRVDADEVTYNLHVILRFEIEVPLIEEKIKVRDLPEIWNEKMQSFLGIRPPNNKLGVLQDVHWSSGIIGYFPTYTLGNLYAAQFFNTMKKELTDFDSMVSNGRFSPILNWLRTNIHQFGRYYSANKLCEKVTGEPLNDKYLLNYLEEKFC